MRQLSKFRHVITCSVLLGGAAPATAQETVNWTGFTWGLTGSYAEADGELLPAVAVISGVDSQNPQGGAIGLMVAYHHQFANNFVLGYVLEGSFGDLDSSRPDGNFLRYTSEIDTFGSLSLRLGYATGRWLPYISLGVTAAEIGYGQSCPAGAISGTCAISGAYNVMGYETQSDPTIGIGVRYAARNGWIFGVEYSETEFEEQTFSYRVPGNLVDTRRIYDTSFRVLRFSAERRF